MNTSLNKWLIASAPLLFLSHLTGTSVESEFAQREGGMVSPRVYEKFIQEVQPELLEFLKATRFITEKDLLERAHKAVQAGLLYVRFLEGVCKEPRFEFQDVGVPSRPASTAEVAQVQDQEDQSELHSVLEMKRFLGIPEEGFRGELVTHGEKLPAPEKNSGDDAAKKPVQEPAAKPTPAVDKLEEKKEGLPPMKGLLQDESSEGVVSGNKPRSINVFF